MSLLPETVAGLDLGALSSLSPAPGVDIAHLTPAASNRLQELDTYAGRLGLKGTITSGKRSWSQPSAHNAGEAVDLVLPGDMPAHAQRLRQAGFLTTYEPKGQRNANGTTATGNHIHTTLRGDLPPETVATIDLHRAGPRMASSLSPEQVAAQDLAAARKQAPAPKMPAGPSPEDVAQQDLAAYRKNPPPASVGPVGPPQPQYTVTRPSVDYANIFSPPAPAAPPRPTGPTPEELRVSGPGLWDYQEQRTIRPRTVGEKIGRALALDTGPQDELRQTFRQGQLRGQFPDSPMPKGPQQEQQLRDLDQLGWKYLAMVRHQQEGPRRYSLPFNPAGDPMAGMIGQSLQGAQSEAKLAPAWDQFETWLTRQGVKLSPIQREALPSYLAFARLRTGATPAEVGGSIWEGGVRGVEAAAGLVPGAGGAIGGTLRAAGTAAAIGGGGQLARDVGNPNLTPAQKAGNAATAGIVGGTIGAVTHVGAAGLGALGWVARDLHAGGGNLARGRAVNEIAGAVDQAQVMPRGMPARTVMAQPEGAAPSRQPAAASSQPGLSFERTARAVPPAAPAPPAVGDTVRVSGSPELGYLQVKEIRPNGTTVLTKPGSAAKITAPLDQLERQAAPAGMSMRGGPVTPEPAVSAQPPAVSPRAAVGQRLTQRYGSAAVGSGQPAVPGGLPPAVSGQRGRFATNEQGLVEMNAGPRFRLNILKDSQDNLRNFDDTLAARSGLTHNLSQLEAAHYPSAIAVRTAAAAPQIAERMASSTEAGIDRIYGRPQAFKDFYGSLQDSNLLGAAQRYRDLAGEALKLPDDAFSAKNLPDTLEVMRRIEGPANLAGSQAVEGAVQRGDLDAARRALMANYSQAADLIEKRLGPQRIQGLQQAMADPRFGRALDLYRQTVEQPLRDYHAAVGGSLLDPAHLGPAGAYFPLTAVDANGAVLQPKGGAGGLFAFARPKNPRAGYRTGLSESYSYDPQVFRDQLRRAVGANTRAHMWDALEDAGLVKTVPSGAPTPAGGYLFGKKTYSPSVEAAGPARKFLGPDGVTFTQGPSKAVMPQWLHNELMPVLKSEAGSIRNTSLGQILGGATKAATIDPLVGAVHGRNLLSVLTSNTPYLEGLAGKLPVAKTFAAVGQVLREDMSSPENLAIQRELADLGLLHPETGSVTASRAYAASTGAKLNPVKAGLYGPSGMDVRTRVILYKALKGYDPQATPRDVINFVGQAGQYIRPLQGGLQRALGGSISPFFEAGKQMTANGIRATVPGLAVVPGTGLRAAGLKAAQQLTGGLTGMTAAWAVAHKAETGQWPWEAGTPFGMLPVPDEHRMDPAVTALWGSDPRKTAYVDMLGALAPGVKRGARALGASGVYNTMQAGGTAGQGQEKGKADIINSLAHPVLGPPVQFGVRALLGVEPHLSAVRDPVTGRPSMVLRSSAPKAPPGEQDVSNVRSAATALLPTVQNIMGEERGGEDSSRILRAALAWTGGVGPAVDQNQQYQRLLKAQKVAERPEKLR